MVDNTEQARELYDRALNAAGGEDFAAALRLLDRVIELDPDFAEAHYKRGNALKRLGQLQAAVASYDQAIERNPRFAHAYCNRGVVQQALGMNADALQSYEQAAIHNPIDALTHYNRALLLQEFSRWDEAIASYDLAISADPAFTDAQYNRSLALLYCGHFEEGWRSYESRWKLAGRLGIGELKTFSQGLWLGGKSLARKRLLLHSEGGLGDTLQFCRYAALAAELGAEVYLEVESPLRAVLAKLDGLAGIIERGSELPEFDYHCPLMSLPLAFDTTLNNVPPPAKPLQSDATRQWHWDSMTRAAGAPRVGLVWSGNPQNPTDRRRSVRLAELIARLPAEYRYYRLQRDISEQDKPLLASCSFINSNDEDVQDFLHIAALCKCMDLVISVDTSVAHLSASLGRPTWLMLPLVPDWRWLRGRQDSPWYPTMRIFRQETSGDWGEVFRRIAADLRREFPRQ